MSTEIPTLADLSRIYASPLDDHLDTMTSGWSSRLVGSVVALEAVGDLMPAILTPIEDARVTTMAPRRRRAYLAGRIALKRLAGKWGHVPQDRPARRVDTSQKERPEPLCGLGPGAPAGCSLTHDSHFAVAVAADRRVGVDLEAITPRLRRIATGFASASEMRIAEGSALGHLAALARIFTLKEAVVKATSGELFKVFREVETVCLGERKSTFTWHGRRYAAHHDELSGHLLTVFLHDG